jgi:protein SCO1
VAPVGGVDVTRRSLRALIAALAAVAAALALAACGSGGEDAAGTTAAGADRFAAADTLPPGLAGRAAARMRLTDARGGTLDSARLAGTPYLVTFLFTNCPDVCPLIGQEIREALEQLGPDARRVVVVAVSVDPRGDTPEAVRAWLDRQRQPPQFHYLIGSERELAPVWRAWYAAPQIAGDPDSAHTAVVWLVDADGRLAGKLDAGASFEPGELADDLRTLLRDARSPAASGS